MMLKSLFPSSLLKLTKAISRNNRAKHTYVKVSTTFDNFFWKGTFMKMNNPIRMEVNIRIGRAYIGLSEKTAITRAYISFLK